MALPCGATRSLRPTFVPARAVALAVRLPFAFALYRPVSNRPEGTIARLRYSLGGDRPSQTPHQTGSSTRINGPELELQNNQGGISRTAPPALAREFQSLPPILHRSLQNSLSSWSKGSRGLSVLLRVNRIFTAISTSLRTTPRQRPDRYAIRAGRNLPDKEFRYLRTVIVTAAVYRGFDSRLWGCPRTSPVNLPAPGRRHTLYVRLIAFAECCVFAKQSPGPLRCNPPGLGPARGLHLLRAVLLPKLRTQFAEFLSVVYLTRL